MAYFRTPNKNEEASLQVSLSPIDPDTGYPEEWDKLKARYSGITFSNGANVMLRFENNKLNVKVVSNLGVTIESTLSRKAPSEQSEIAGVDMLWDEYKSMVNRLCGKNNLFRGQRRALRLRTLFHRAGRYDLSRFITEDRVKLHRILSARTTHFFNLEVPIENGAFINLIQHHGYPTPLLDWTRSPYVAAFFAFRNVPKITQDQDQPIRIFIFDYDKWANDLIQYVSLNPAWPHISVLEFAAIDNQRLIPQQSITTVTNIDDIEGYIKYVEEKNKCSYLQAVNIPPSERNKAMGELAFMGITAGSMFPGLDGICEEMRGRMFDS